MEKLTRYGRDQYCRVCGTSHRYGFCGDPPSPLQIAQMSVEELEEFMTNIKLISGDRQTIKQRFSQLRNALGIPIQPIFAKSRLARGMAEVVKNNPKFKKILERQKKEKLEKEKEGVYKPNMARVTKARDLLNEIKSLINAKALMTESEEGKLKKQFAETFRVLNL